jgi:hypothetical protein
MGGTPSFGQGGFYQYHYNPQEFLAGRHDALSAAVRRWSETEDTEAKEKLAADIRSMLQKQYDAFLDANEKQIADLQKRLEKLREQLERRRQAKEKMVEMEWERLVNESEGLIWPRGSNMPFDGTYPAPPDAPHPPAPENLGGLIKSVRGVDAPGPVHPRSSR